MLLSPALLPNKTVKEIEWSFSSGTGTTIQVAEFGPDSFNRPDPKDRFKDRLEMVNKTALRIGVLERGDSGVYGARLKLHPALVEDQSFHLSVYGAWLRSSGRWGRGATCGRGDKTFCTRSYRHPGRGRDSAPPPST